MAVYTSTQAADGMVATKYGVGSSEVSVTPVIDSTGNISTAIITATDKFQLGAAAGAAGSFVLDGVTKTGIVDSTATSVLTVSVTNVAASAVIRLLVRSGITAASHLYDSTRVVEYLVTLTRVAGANLVAGISAAIGAQIATTAGGGQTLTTALTLAAVAGGVTATNTFDIQVTNVVSVAGTSSTTIVYEIYTVGAGVTIAAA